MSDNYLSALQSFKEDDFTKKILKPLFEAMGYQRVDFHGGQYERGRDLIATYYLPPRREPRIVFLQSKKIHDIQNVQEGAKITTLLHQLRQCCSEKLKLLDGTEAPADEVYLACPDKISTRLTEEIFSQLSQYKDKVRIYDGPQIIEDIKRYNPVLLELLTSIKDKLTSHSNEELINIELLQALKTESHVELENFYSDLSFFVGSIDSNYLLHLNVDVSTEMLNISNDEWHLFKSEVLGFSSTYSLDVMSGSLISAEENYNLELADYVSPENDFLIKKVGVAERELIEIENSMQKTYRSLTEYVNNFLGMKKMSSVKVEKECLRFTRSAIDSINESNNLDEFSEITIKKYPDNLPPNIKKEIVELHDIKKKILTKRNELNELKNRLMPEPYYRVVLNKSAIEDRINEIKDSYIKTVSDINSSKLSRTEIRDFLQRIEIELRLISDFVNNDFLCKKRIKIKVDKVNDDRVSISPHAIFDTGFDIAVYGGAGVGKTTTLQVYARENKRDGVIYLPLNRVSNKIDIHARKLEGRDFYKIDLIWKSILISKDITPTSDDLANVKELLKEGTVIILDGLDEIYSSIPEIIAGIEEFKSKNPKIQVIISSRDCVSYLKKINFLGITLLPFTRLQLEHFIHGWLGCKQKSMELIKIINEYNLFDYIRTPLLATITCSLMEKGVKIPSNESAIYTERLNLLTGEYDQYKVIRRQKHAGELLRKCAMTIAYGMQRNNVRMSSKASMLAFLKESLMSHYTIQLLEECLNELIDPCNIIIYDRVSDTFSFGHLRFQEHLASLKLKSDRNIDICALTKFDWWRGTLGLYAQDSEFSHLFEDIYKCQGNLNMASKTLDYMIDNAPAKNRSSLRSLFDRYIESDRLDSCFDELEYYDDFF